MFKTYIVEIFTGHYLSRHKWFLISANIIWDNESEVAQSSPTLSDPMDCSLPGSCVHGIFQARVLEWVAIAFSNA